MATYCELFAKKFMKMFWKIVLKKTVKICNSKTRYDNEKQR